MNSFKLWVLGLLVAVTAAAGAWAVWNFDLR